MRLSARNYLSPLDGFAPREVRDFINLNQWYKYPHLAASSRGAFKAVLADDHIGSRVLREPKSQLSAAKQSFTGIHVDAIARVRAFGSCFHASEA